MCHSPSPLVVRSTHQKIQKAGGNQPVSLGINLRLIIQKDYRMQVRVIWCSVCATYSAAHGSRFESHAARVFLPRENICGGTATTHYTTHSRKSGINYETHIASPTNIEKLKVSKQKQSP
ncbi:unnamed protein product [Ectocarpus sp. 12 AP-2014]